MCSHSTQVPHSFRKLHILVILAFIHSILYKPLFDQLSISKVFLYAYGKWTVSNLTFVLLTFIIGRNKFRSKLLHSTLCDLDTYNLSSATPRILYACCAKACLKHCISFETRYNTRHFCTHSNETRAEFNSLSSICL